MALHSLTNEGRLPSRGKAGDVYYCGVGKVSKVFYVVADGTLINLSDIMAGGTCPELASLARLASAVSRDSKATPEPTVIAVIAVLLVRTAQQGIVANVAQPVR